MKITLASVAALIGGDVEGDASVEISHPDKIEVASPGALTFLGNVKYETYLYTTKASAVIVDRDFKPKQAVLPTLLRVDNVYVALAKLLDHFGHKETIKPGIADSAVIDGSATIGDSVSIGDFVVIGPNCVIGDDVQLHSHVYIGSGSTVGAGTKLYPGVKVMRHCVVGKHCIIHANAVVGSDGFGFTPNESGRYDKVSQIGNVQVGDYVEIGANTTIDRATMGSTIIEDGVKLDNLIQIGHNAVIGKHTVIAAQTGVSGSTALGERCMIGGQVGFVGHLDIADKTQIQAQSGIASSIKEPGKKLYGYPAIGYRDYLKSYARFRQLPDMAKELQSLKEEIEILKRKS